MNNQKGAELEQLIQICFKTKPWMGDYLSQSTHPCMCVRVHSYTYTHTPRPALLSLLGNVATSSGSSS